MTEDEMVGWHHQLYGHEFEQAPGVGDGQGSLACCSPWGHKESDMTEWLNWLTCAVKAAKLHKSLCGAGIRVPRLPLGIEHLHDIYRSAPLLCFQDHLQQTKYITFWGYFHNFFFFLMLRRAPGKCMNSVNITYYYFSSQHVFFRDLKICIVPAHDMTNPRRWWLVSNFNSSEQTDMSVTSSSSISLVIEDS